MGLTGDTLVRMIDGSDRALSDLEADWRANGLNFRLFTVQEPWTPVASAGSTMAGLIVAELAGFPRITRRQEPVAIVQLSFRTFAAPPPDEPPPDPCPVVRCSASQLFLMNDGSWRTARDLRPRDLLRSLVTDILPGTNGDLMPLPDGHNISSTSLKFPETRVVSVTMPGAVEDVYDLYVPKWHSYGLTARVFAHDAG